jgi:hypothetical protein
MIMYTLEAALILSPSKLAVAKNDSGQTVVVRELPEQYDEGMSERICQYRLSVINYETVEYDYVNTRWVDFNYDMERFLSEQYQRMFVWFPVGYASPF